MNVRQLSTITLLSFVAAAVLGMSACADDKTRCSVVWVDAMGNEVGDSSYKYNTTNATKAAELCGVDQMSDPERPASAVGHSCDCETF